MPPAEITLSAGQLITDAYTVGQVLKCTVIGTDSKKGLRLSLRGRGTLAVEKAGADASNADRLAPFKCLSVLTVARVERIIMQEGEPGAVASFVLLVVSSCGSHTAPARLEAAHLSDHSHAALALASALQVGACPVVLDRFRYRYTSITQTWIQRTF